MPMKCVIIESPFAGDIDRNLSYLRACMADALANGEAPFASHALYTQPGVLDDAKPLERYKGISAGFAWWPGAQKVVFYVDLGWSSGMADALELARATEKPYELRSLGGDWSRYTPNPNPTPI